MLKLTDGCLYLSVYVQPKASRDKWLGRHGDEIKLAITAPPIDGKANDHVIRLIAKQCKVAKSKVTLIRGQQSRHKHIKVESPTIIPKELSQYLT